MAGNDEIDKLGTSSAAAAAQLTAHESAAIANGLLAGSPATVARQLNEIAAVQGTGGILMSFDDDHETVDRFGAEVVPLLDFDLTAH
ncbi:MAG: hypothetical protein JWR66_2314 [Modestobacter sp.]|nr:hypothetical protein [Modestobacter sp.]